MGAASAYNASPHLTAGAGAPSAAARSAARCCSAKSSWQEGRGGGEMISVASLVDGGEWRKVGMRSAGLDNRALARASTALRTFLGIDAL